MPWLLKEGEVLATAEAADTRRERMRGLIGRDHFEGAFILHPCHNVHTMRMQFSIDVAFIDQFGKVIGACTLKPWRISPWFRRAKWVIEAEEGAFERWKLKVGDTVELKS